MLPTIDDYILGNGLLHRRFGAAIRILGKLISVFPDSVTVDELKNLTGLVDGDLEDLCGRLSLGGLLQSDRLTVDAWILACDPVQTTLEDVFRCILAEQLDSTRRATTTPSLAPRLHRDVDLLLMQVALAINQSAFKHLRLFSLDRLRNSVTA